MFYYLADGTFFKITIISGDSFPKKFAQYDRRGNLICTGIMVSKSEQYLFNKRKKLVTHWIGNYAYDGKGNKSTLSRNDY